MALKLIRQGTGKLAVYNTETQCIDVWDMSPEAVVDYLFLHEAGATISWSKAITAMREAHGWAAVGVVLDSMECEAPPAGG